MHQVVVVAERQSLGPGLADPTIAGVGSAWVLLGIDHTHLDIRRQLGEPVNVLSKPRVSTVVTEDDLPGGS